MTDDRRIDPGSHEKIVARARERFWTEGPLFAMLPQILRWCVRRKSDADFALFFPRPDYRAGIMVSAGLFFCAGALGHLERLTSLNGLVVVPGIYLLSVGLYRGWGILTRTDPAGRAP